MVRVFDRFDGLDEKEKFISEDQVQLQLLKAVLLCDLDEAEKAIVRGAKLNYTDSHGNTLLSLAISSGNEKIVDTLLKHGADVNYTDSHGNTLLSLAISSGNEKIVDTLLKHGADVNYTDYHGNAPLSLAISSGNEKIVDALLKHGADVNYTDSRGNTPLSLAISLKRANCVEMLMRSKEGNCDFINYAIKNNNTELMIMLVQNGYKHPSTENNLKKAMPELLPSPMKSVIRTYQFLYNTGYFKVNKHVPQKVLDASIAVSDFIENKPSRSSNFDG
ncbi:shigella flexneri OspC family protein [Orientia tsutsugamushi str. Gilliam]|uniref:Ankyrin repeat-containing protein 13 n=1 Tax=Orientia tsutsugamushi str. Gilliam TaxID=1359184 RepID=A0A0F3MGI1_ORITS|nr:ankyrin repeat domain-containing protein [Orientia tsutsugamushi]KJV53659.1 shigella flexneri OspC family protein [Orientia tsutsugamushi str. Gilliam]SPR06075.1 ankyrin repeat-containing protein 13 [Orientia tsutsugamushi str. Gilliam]